MEPSGKDFIRVQIFYLLGNNFTLSNKESEAEKIQQKEQRKIY